MKKSYGEIVFTELIRSIFIVLIGFLGLFFWEKQKIENQVLFSKKIDIISEERNNLIEIAEGYSQAWSSLMILKNDLKNTNTDCFNDFSFIQNLNFMIKLTNQTDLILGNKLLNTEELNELHNLFVQDTENLFKNLNQCLIESNDYESLTKRFDKIISLYNKDIISRLKS